MNDGVCYAQLASGRLEYEWIAPERAASLLVFLHEGLGSLAMWRDWPRRLCDAGGLRGLVYSRPGYGRSTPRRQDERWPFDFMHTQALEVLPELLQAAGVGTQEYWLVGHSDGASIALIHAALIPERVAGLVVLAPHVFVEDLSLSSIRNVRQQYMTTTDTPGGGLRGKLARYHHDPDSAFWGWNDIWLDPSFRRWNIEGLLPRIRAPVLAIQGEDDEYGTMAQIDSIATRVPRAELLKLEACGHSPHRDQSQRVVQATLDFFTRQTGRHQ